MRREFLSLAQVFKEGKHKLAGKFVSEKLDGTRCFWDGGITRDVATADVPWANIYHPKTGERKAKIKRVATGLWSRYGNPIMAPDWFLNLLPHCFLDGELFAGRGNFQHLRSIVAGDTADDDRWGGVEFAVFGSPSVQSVFALGHIKNANFDLHITTRCIEFFKRRANPDFAQVPFGACALEEFRFLDANLPTDKHVYMLAQKQLPTPEAVARDTLEIMLQKIVADGGEGVVLRDPDKPWVPKRTDAFLKMKPLQDDEATVVGFTAGRGKHAGRIGALITDYKGQRLELGGLTDREREFVGSPECVDGQDMPAGTEGTCFKVGDSVTFRYLYLTDDGIPREARYWRKR